MKTKSFILIALAMVAALSMVSCKCCSKKSRELTQEEVQEMKQVLADSVLAEIDAIAADYIQASENAFRIANFELTEEEKMVKPDYLLDPSFANTLVTKSQKVNALAFFLTDLTVRTIYDMPLEETKEVIAKLAAEVNHPVDIDVISDFEMPISEKYKKVYQSCKERGDVAYYWQFQIAVMMEISYILAQNAELFFSKITEEQWQQYVKRSNEKNKAMRELAKYDEEMAAVLEVFNQNRVVSSDEEKQEINTSKDSAKRFRIANKEKYIARRNALLQ